jgi:DNA-binding MarR family transcriptional regulator
MAKQAKDGADEDGKNHPAFSYGILPSLIGYNIRRAQVAVFADFADSLTEVDITPGQFGVLVLISENGGLNQTRLGNGLGVDRSTVVAVIDRLQARGLVARTPAPGDRRSYALQLSPAGQDLLARAKRLVAAHEARIGEPLSAKERQTLKTLLGKLSRD